MTKIIHEEFDYCGVCPHLKNIIYYETEPDFQNEADDFKEDIFCDFFIWPIKLSKKEYETIPKWCPLQNKEETL